MWNLIVHYLVSYDLECKNFGTGSGKTNIYVQIERE